MYDAVTTVKQLESWTTSLAELLSCQQFESVDEILEAYEDEITNAGFVYYHDALEFLKCYDPSLINSASYAEELGYPVNKIDSTLLANLLLARQLQTVLYSNDMLKHIEQTLERITQ